MLRDLLSNVFAPHFQKSINDTTFWAAQTRLQTTRRSVFFHLGCWDPEIGPRFFHCFLGGWGIPKTCPPNNLYVTVTIYGLSRWWFQIFFYFHPYLGKIPILTNISQMG